MRWSLGTLHLIAELAVAANILYYQPGNAVLAFCLQEGLLLLYLYLLRKDLAQRA